MPKQKTAKLTATTEYPYPFRRVDTGALVMVDFETMMRADAAGFVTFEGVELRRVREETKTIKKELDVDSKPIVSDAAGFHHAQLEEFESLRLKHGLTGIEHKPDPQVPGFIQVHATCQSQYEKYLKARGMYNATGSLGGSAMLTERDLERAKKEAISKYGAAKTVQVDPKNVGITVDEG